jgi:hypothetical protein
MYDERNARFSPPECVSALYVCTRRFRFECATCTERCAACYSALPLVDICCRCAQHAEGGSWPHLRLSPVAYTLLMPKKLLFVPIEFERVREMISLANESLIDIAQPRADNKPGDAEPQLVGQLNHIAKLVVTTKLPIVPVRMPLLATMLWGPAPVPAITDSCHLFVHYYFTLQLINAKTQRMVMHQDVAPIIELLEEVDALDKSAATFETERDALDAELKKYTHPATVYAATCRQLRVKVVDIIAEYTEKLRKSLLDAAEELCAAANDDEARDKCLYYVALSCILSLEHMLLEICGFPRQYVPHLTVPMRKIEALLPEHVSACDAEARNVAASLISYKESADWLRAHTQYARGPGGKPMQLKMEEWTLPATFTNDYLGAIKTARDFNTTVICVVLKHMREAAKKPAMEALPLNAAAKVHPVYTPPATASALDHDVVPVPSAIKTVD